MIRNAVILQNFEDSFLQSQAGSLTLQESLRIMDALWQEAVTLGVSPGPDPLEGIEVKIRIAKILNACLKK